jgi:hypothetical protein
MLRFDRVAPLLLAPALAVLLALGGCSGDKKDDKKVGDGDKSEQEKVTGTRAELTPVAAQGLGTLKGKVTYDGTPPAPGDFKAQMEAQGDRVRCLMGDTKDPTWTVGADKGVKNVVVWLRPPAGKYFQIPEDQQKPADPKVTIDQPFCAFEPHVVVLYPSFWDGKSKNQKPTGQEFKVLNSAPMNHNTEWKGNSLFNSGKNEILQPKKDMLIQAKACPPKRTGEDLITLRCDIHKWMNAYAWAIDHPYAAVTKEDGSYEIKNIPGGADVEIAYWHESFGTKPKTEKFSTKDGENTKDFTITKE